MEGLHDASRELDEYCRLPLEETPSIAYEVEYVPIGCTIYRTDYSPHTDSLWEKLTADLVSNTAMEIRSTFEHVSHIASEAKAIEKLVSLVQIDARSDKSVLDGRNDEELREIFKNGTGGTPLNAIPWERQRLFLVADATVFARLGSRIPWVKAVEVDYNAAAYDVSRHPRFAPRGQYYWGWMKLSICSLFFLWRSLPGLEIQELAPPMFKPEMVKARIYDGGIREDDDSD